MRRQAGVVLYLLALIAVVVVTDVLFFRHHIWERLLVNVGIVVVFATFYWPHPTAISAMPFTSSQAGTLRLTRLIRDVRASAGTQPGQWQDIVDGLRPHVSSLWEHLPEADKRLFLRHVVRVCRLCRTSGTSAGLAASLAATGRSRRPLFARRGHRMPRRRRARRSAGP